LISNEGYIPLHHLYDEAYSIADREISTYLNETIVTPLQLFTRRSEDILFNWFEDFYGPSVYLSNGIDIPIRLSKWAIKHRFYALIWQLDFPDLLDKISHLDLKNKFHIADPLPSFWVEGPQEGEKEPTEEEWIVFKDKMIHHSIGGAMVPLLINQNTWTIDLSLFRFVMENDSSQEPSFHGETIEHANFLERFEGYALCVPEKHYHDKWQQHWHGIASRKIARFESLESGFESNDQNTNPGRPRKREAVAETYQRLFPHGRQGSTWKQVMLKIEQDSGIRASVDTLKRALK